MGTITFSAERSNPPRGVCSRCAVCSRYAVDVGTKKSTHTVGVCSRCTVCSGYAVDVGAKRSTHTVDLGNMGGGDHYHTVGYAVGMQYAVHSRYAVGSRYL